MNSVKFDGHQKCPLCRAEIPYDVLCSIYDYDYNENVGNDGYGEEGYDEDNIEDDDDSNDNDDDEEQE
jgi:hypothetical protein